jgi:hypothetical protein
MATGGNPAKSKSCPGSPSPNPPRSPNPVAGPGRLGVGPVSARRWRSHFASEGRGSKELDVRKHEELHVSRHKEGLRRREFFRSSDGALPSVAKRPTPFTCCGAEFSGTYRLSAASCWQSTGATSPSPFLAFGFRPSAFDLRLLAFGFWLSAFGFRPWPLAFGLVLRVLFFGSSRVRKDLPRHDLAVRVRPFGGAYSCGLRRGLLRPPIPPSPTVFCLESCRGPHRTRIRSPAHDPYADPPTRTGSMGAGPQSLCRWSDVHREVTTGAGVRQSGHSPTL